MVPSSFAAAVVVAVLALPVRATPTLTFEQGLGQLRQRVIDFRRQQVEDGAVGVIIRRKGWDQFPAPDAATKAWLSGRVPGIDTSKVRIVPPDVADEVMAWAAGKKTTYLDLLTDAIFKRQELYFAPSELLRAINAKYISGTMPFDGRTENGAQFQMQGIVAGQGKVHILYNLQSFSYKDADGTRFKVDNGGRVGVSIRGAADIGVEGLSTYGAPVFCPWARINRMVKDGAYSVRVETNCGARGGNRLQPVRLRSGAR